jgi:hypothetical protein
MPLSGLAPLAGILGGFQQAQQIQNTGLRDALVRIQMQQAQEKQRAQDLAWQGYAAQPPSGIQQGVGQDIASSFGAPQQPPQVPSMQSAPGGGQNPFMTAGAQGPPQDPNASNLPQVPSYGGNPMDGAGVRASWFGNAPGWKDPTDSGLQAGGRSVAEAPGIALPSRSTLGSQFDVTTPKGRTFRETQTDVGPAKWTGRGVDINASAAAEMGYTPQTFPTDATFRVKQVTGPAAMQLAKSNVPMPTVKESNNIANNAGAMLNPQMWGGMSRAQIAQAIDQADPEAPPHVKLMAAAQLQQLLAPEERMQMQIQMMGMKAEIQAALRQTPTAHERATEAQGAARLEQGAERLRQEDRRIADQEAKAAAGGGKGLEASKMFDIIDKDGNVVRKVMAREGKDQAGFVDSESGEKIKLEEGQHLLQITPSQTGGGRAQAQIGRQTTGAREVLSDLQNAASLPIGTTTGIFGSVDTGPTVLGAVKGDLIRHLTDQDSRLMQSSMSGIQRELSILESPVYGGAYASKQIDALIPRAGDSVATAMFNLARIKQTADNALESLHTQPILSNDQKKYTVDLRKALDEAIPWTPKQALEFARAGDTKETFSNFVKRGGMEPGAAPPGQAAPTAGGSPQTLEVTKEQYDALPSGSGYKVPGDPTMYYKP